MPTPGNWGKRGKQKNSFANDGKDDDQDTARHPRQRWRCRGRWWRWWRRLRLHLQWSIAGIRKLARQKWRRMIMMRTWEQTCAWGWCIRSRSQIWGTLPECTRSKSISTCTCQTWTSPATYTNTHRQHNHSRYCKQHHQTPTIEIDGNAVLLVIRWWNATILQILLTTRPWKIRWLSI